MRWFVAAVLVLLASVAPSAQRSALYDTERQVRLEGPVTRIEWVNPRAFLFIDVRDPSGVVANWAVEVGNPIDLERSKWTRQSIRIGEVVTVDGVPARGPNRQALGRSIVHKTSGKRLFEVPATRSAAGAGRAAPAPRWPDGQVRLGPAPGQKGYWMASGTAALVDSTAANVRMNDEGLLANIADADRVAPMLPWAKAVYLLRQRTLLKDDPLARCMPPGGPRQFQRTAGARRRGCRRSGSRDVDVGLGQAEPGRGMPDAGQRCPEVALDVDGEGLHRRDVEDAAAPMRVIGSGRSGEPVEGTRGRRPGSCRSRWGRRPARCCRR